MEKCLICKKDYKRVTASHLKKHGISLQQYRNKYLNISQKPVNTGKSKKKFFAELLLSVAITVIVSIILIPMASQALVNFGVYKIGVSPLETSDPRIESTIPQNNDIVDNETVLLFTIISDEGGSGVDWEKSRIELRSENEAISITKDEPTEGALEYIPVALEKGKYIMNVFAYDKSGNDDFRQITFEVKKKIDIKIIPDNVPLLKDAKYFAKVIVQNEGTKTLENLDFSYRFLCDENMVEEKWADKPNSVLFENESMTILLEADLNLHCSPSARSNTESFIGLETGTHYLVPDDVNAPVCVSCQTTFSAWSYTEEFRYDQNFLYPFFEGILDITIGDLEGFTIWEKGEEFPEPVSTGLYGFTIIDPWSLCLTHQEPPRWCKEMFTPE